MRVICISNEGTYDEDIPIPEIGSRYNAVAVDKRWGRDYYILEEFGPEFGYLTSIFATLPDVSEETLAEEEGEYLDAELAELMQIL